VREEEAEDQVTEPAAIPAAGGPAGGLPPLPRVRLINQPELPLLAAQPPLLPAWRVIDLSQAISGPYAARILSDLGADVLRIEGPRIDVTEYFGVAAGQRSGMYSQMNAGKRSVGVDLAVTGAADLVRDLATRADVLIENFRPGVMERFGLGYEQLSGVNPALIMVSVTGFGADGPDAQRRALAPVIHAESGLLARQAELDDREPSDLPLALADTVTALHAAIAVLAALHQRTVTGRGQHISLSMLAALAASDDHAHAAIAGSGEPYTSRGTIWRAPGGPLLIAAPPKHAWAMLSRRGLIADPAPPVSDLPVKARLRQQAIQDWMASFADRASLIAELEQAGVAWADVRDSTDVFAGGAHSVRLPGTGIRVASMPYEFSAGSASVRRAVASKGEHNAEALAEWLGLDETAVASLTGRGILIED
jgi:crotonobetainyl-CoA:carnitine CoA-transferase CaiB-like acyl-CoA transferase